MSRTATAIVLSCIPSLAALAGETGYYRWPVVHGEELVFASEGDLWRAPRGGGAAVRLTTHPEEESRPTILPDGRWLAFNAHYDGAMEVYVMPLSGGAPTQLTFEGGGTAVRGWTADGKVLFRSSTAPGTTPRLLRTVDMDNLNVETLPLMAANLATFAGDGRTLFFTRFGLSLRNDNAILYRGGGMAQLWRYKLDGDAEAVRLAVDFGTPIRHPMWWNGRIYYVSDKSGVDNIWSVDETGDDARQHTRFDDWQLRNPRLNDGEIVYQRGADLFRYDVRGGKETKIMLTLVSDRDYGRMRWLKNPIKYLETSLMGAEGESVALTARGRVAVAFPGDRRRVVLDVPGQARARAAVVGAKGDWVYVVLDQDRYGEIWRYPSDGRGPPEKLTDGSDAHIWGIYPAPDAQLVLIDDKRGRLWSLDVETGDKLRIDTSESGVDQPFEGFAWSSGGRYVAYSTFDVRSIRRLVLHDLKSGRRENVTSGKYDSYAPAFSADNKWLYFVSDRNFVAAPSHPWGDRIMGPVFDKRGKLFALQLDPKAHFPFASADELTNAATEETSDQGGKAETKTKDIEIVFDGLSNRLWEVPVAPGNYGALAANGNFLYVLVRNGKSSHLNFIAINSDKPKLKIFARNVKGFALAADGRTLFYRTNVGRNFTLALVPATGGLPKDLSIYTLRIRDWRIGIDPRAEWRQMLLDAWRLHRDFAFDQTLRGVDWNAVLEKYIPFSERIGHRSELDDILGQMIAEFGVLHSQIRPGDLPRDNENGAPAFLGAEFSSASRGFEITLSRRCPMLC